MKIEINRDERVLLMAALSAFAEDEHIEYKSPFYDECMALYNRLLNGEEEGK